MSRVVLLCRVDGNFGGVERFILSLARGMNRQRYHPVIVGIANEGELLRQARDSGIEVEFLPMRSRLSVPFASKQLKYIVQQKNASLLHTFGLRSNALAGWMNRPPTLPWIIRLPNINTTDYQNALRGWISHWINNGLIRKADALQVISPQLESFVRSWHKPPQHVYSIHNGVDVDHYNPERVEESIRETYSISENAFLLGSVGRLDAIKGFDGLIRSLHPFLQKHPHVYLVIAGEGPERHHLQQFINERNLQQRIFLAGFHEDVRPYLRSFDLYVCSSHSEGVPMAMLEAMAMGVPVLSTRVGGIDSVIEDGVSGLLVPSGNMEQLVQWIERLMDDIEERKRLGENARKRIEQHFSVQRMIEQVQTMYDEVLDRVAL